MNYNSEQKITHYRLNGHKPYNRKMTSQPVMKKKLNTVAQILEKTTTTYIRKILPMIYTDMYFE